jgi:hypothetical protein
MSGGDSYTSFSVSVGADSRVTCHHYSDRTPILVIDVSGVSVQISAKGRDATESAAQFARSLAHHAQAFADEVERLHAESTAPDTADAAEQAA